MGWARGERDEGCELELEGGDFFGEGGVVGAGQRGHFGIGVGGMCWILKDDALSRWNSRGALWRRRAISG